MDCLLQEIFLTYIAPCHYNAVRRRTRSMPRVFALGRTNSAIDMAMRKAAQQGLPPSQVASPPACLRLATLTTLGDAAACSAHSYFRAALIGALTCHANACRFARRLTQTLPPLQVAIPPAELPAGIPETVFERDSPFTHDSNNSSSTALPAVPSPPAGQSPNGLQSPFATHQPAYVYTN